MSELATKYAVVIYDLQNSPQTFYCNDWTELQKAINDNIPYSSFTVSVNMKKLYDNVEVMQKEEVTNE